MKKAFFPETESSLVRVLMLGLLAALFSQCAHAQTITFLDAKLPVNSLSEVDSEQVAVEVGGGTFIVKKSDLGRRVASAYASHLELARSLPWSTYAHVIGQAAQQGEIQVAREATRTFLESANLTDEEIKSFISSLLSSGDGEKVVGELVSKIPPETSAPTRSACEALLALSVIGTTRGANQSAVLAPWARRGCLEHNISQALEILKKGALDEAQPRLRAISGLFQSDDQSVGAARKTADIIDAIVSARARQDLSALGQALQLLRVDPLGREAYSVVAGVTLNESIKKSFEANNLDAVFQGLSLVDFTVRSTQHHEWLYRALGTLTYGNRQNLLSPPVQRMLWAYASKDELIKERYIAILQDFIAQSLKAGEADSAAIFLQELTQVRPDPSAANDEARILLAEALARGGRDAESRRVLSSVSTGVPLPSRLRLALGNPRFFLVILGALSSAGIIGFIIGRSRRRRRTSPLTAKSETREGAGGDTGGRERDFVAYARDPLLGEEFSEYRECLALFGLIEGVKLAEIKTAYRNTVKSCHPDLNPHASKEDAQRFIDLTKAYDRLLVLHKERFKGKTL